MKKIQKVFILIVSIILAVACTCLTIYLVNRKICLENNDLLLTYESLEPLKIVEETVDSVIYKDYIFGEEIGRVIVRTDGEGVTVRDNKNGFVKEYRYHVLYSVYDFKKDELLAEIKSYLNPKFWFGGARYVVTKYCSPYRADEECRRTGQLLSEKQYDKITENRKNKIVVTKKGTYFVN